MKVRGIRAVYEHKQGKAIHRVMALVVQNDAQVCVQCGAPEHLFGIFEETFLRVCNSLELFEPVWVASNEK